MSDSISDSPKPVVTPDDDDYAGIVKSRCEWKRGGKQCDKRTAVYHVELDLYLCAECANQEEM